MELNVFERAISTSVVILLIGVSFYFFFKPVNDMAEKQLAEYRAYYTTYGCYPIKKEYQLCGPVKDKPGYTECETKTKLVCPEE